jgi:hypothetical protein
MPTSDIEWSGDTIDRHLVVFAERGSSMMHFARENGKIVARTSGGMMVGRLYSIDEAQIAEWMNETAECVLG